MRSTGRSWPSGTRTRAPKRRRRSRKRRKSTDRCGCYSRMTPPSRSGVRPSFASSSELPACRKGGEERQEGTVLTPDAECRVAADVWDRVGDAADVLVICEIEDVETHQIGRAS